MNKFKSSKRFDLEERTFSFAKECRDFVRSLKKDQAILEYSKQLIRSSSSVAANYIEANEALSRKDYFHRVRICRKECKECILWFKLCNQNSIECSKLKQEAFELMRIFGAILEKDK